MEVCFTKEILEGNVNRAYPIFNEDLKYRVVRIMTGYSK
jgi:hypothetical protein